MNSIEHGYQFFKCWFLGDLGLAQQIAEGTMTPLECKRATRRVKPLPGRHWSSTVKLYVMRQLIRQKYAIDVYKTALLRSRPIVCEAVRGDRFWSTGLARRELERLDLSSPRRYSRDAVAFPGRNWMGRIHMEQRDHPTKTIEAPDCVLASLPFSFTSDVPLSTQFEEQIAAVHKPRSPRSTSSSNVVTCTVSKPRTSDLQTAPKPSTSDVPTYTVSKPPTPDVSPAQHEAMETNETTTDDGLLLTDAHFHLDILCKKEKIEGKPRTLLLPLQNFFMLATSYCFPERFPSQEFIENAKDLSVINCVGWHPRDACDSEKFLTFYEKVQNLITYVFVHAIGEIGLDYVATSAISDEKKRKTAEQSQMYVFLHMLREAAARKLPVVLHCRSVPGTTNATTDAIKYIQQLMTKEDVTVNRFYLHCLSSIEDYALWNAAFGSKMWFGLNPGLIERSDDVFKTFVKTFPSFAKFLLESDAPYLCAKSSRNRVNRPDCVEGLAAMLAGDNMSKDNVLRLAKQNFKSFYGV